MFINNKLSLYFSPLESFASNHHIDNWNLNYINDFISLRSFATLTCSAPASTFLITSFLFFLLTFLFVENTNKEFEYSIWSNWVEVFNEHAKSKISAINIKLMRFYPLLLFVFFFVWFLNFAGLFYGSFCWTAQLISCLMISSSMFIGFTCIGIFYNKWNFFNLFLPAGSPFIMMPFLIIIELISYVVRVFSLAIRLFANIMAGHTLVKILACLGWAVVAQWPMFAIFPFLLLVFVLCVELLVSLLQSIIFLNLFCIYLNDAIYLH